MAKLTAKGRSALPSKDFAGPGRSFPIENASHARAAITGATRSANAGNISPSTAATIKAAARAKLSSSKSTAAPKKKAAGRSSLVRYAKSVGDRLK